MKFFYALFMGMVIAGIYCFTIRFYSPGADPAIVLLSIAILFVFGCIIG